MSGCLCTELQVSDPVVTTEASELELGSEAAGTVAGRGDSDWINKSSGRIRTGEVDLVGGVVELRLARG